MRCGLCGNEFVESEGTKGCGACIGGCHGIHCPRCGYRNVQEPDFLKRIKKIITGNDKE